MRLLLPTPTSMMSEPLLELSDIFHSSISLEPLYCATNTAAVTTLLDMIKTSIGPNGKLKIVQNAPDGCTVVTSSSSRFFHIAPIKKNIIHRFLVSSVKTHLSVFGNGGMYCALLILCLHKNSLKSSVPSPLISELFKYFGRTFVEILKSTNGCTFSVDLSNLSQLRRIVCCIISSKPGCLLTRKHKDSLTILLIKAFINTIPSCSDRSQICVLRSISFCTQSGCSPTDSKLLNGLLVKIQESITHEQISQMEIKSVSVGVLKVALFSTSLAGDADFVSNQLQEYKVSVQEEVLSHLKKIAMKLIFDGVDVVLCQKVVHPSIKRHFRENGVLVLGRLGLEMTYNVQQLTGAVQVPSISDVSNITYGFITSFESFDIGEQKYILLQNEDRPFWSILLCNYNEEALEETKVVCEQSVDTLYRFLKEPKVCCGGGCTEVHIAHLVKKKVLERQAEIANDSGISTSGVIHALDIFLSSIHEVALSLYQGSKFSFVTEATYGHLWELVDGNFPSGDERCKCGQCVASSVHDSQWQFFEQNSSNNPFIDDGKCEGMVSLPSNLLVLDELSAKVNASEVAFETVSSLLQITLCIVSQH